MFVTTAVIGVYLGDYLQNIFDGPAALSLTTHTFLAVQFFARTASRSPFAAATFAPPAPTALARSHRPRHARHRLSSHRSSRQRHRPSPTSSSAHRRPTPTAGPPADLGCGPSSRPSSAPSRPSTSTSTVGALNLGLLAPPLKLGPQQHLGLATATSSQLPIWGLKRHRSRPSPPGTPTESPEFCQHSSRPVVLCPVSSRRSSEYSGCLSHCSWGLQSRRP